jgi:hypothetical protein
MLDLRTAKRIQAVREAASKGPFFKAFFAICREHGVSRIVAYGLGNVVESSISLHQAVFCTLLGMSLGAASLSAYDPVFSPEHWSILQHLGFHEEAAFPGDVISIESTLVFMPHCDGPVNQRVFDLVQQHNLQTALVFANTMPSLNKDDAWEAIPVNWMLYDRHDVFNDCRFYRLVSKDDDQVEESNAAFIQKENQERFF